MSRLTLAGRLANQRLTTSLGWTPGFRVTFTISGWLIVIAADPAGPRKLDSRGDVLVPISVLRSCGLYGGETVLMAALPHRQRLILHPPSVLAQLTDAAHTAALDGAR